MRWVRLYNDQFGRGPNRVRTYWCGDDILTTVLEDMLTPAERNLAALGEHQRLRDTRMFFLAAVVYDRLAEQLQAAAVRAAISALPRVEERL